MRLEGVQARLHPDELESTCFNIQNCGFQELDATHNDALYGPQLCGKAL